MSVMNPVAGNNFSIFFFDAEPLDTSIGGLLETGAGLAIGAVKTFLFGSFSEVSGLDAVLETEEYQEGGANTGPRRFHKWAATTTVTFKKGVTPDPGLWEWQYAVLYGTDTVPRKNAIIVLTDKGLGVAPTGLGLPGLDKLPIAVWFLRRGLPAKVQGPQLKGNGNEIAIESLEVAHEGLVRVGAGMIPGIGGALAGLGL
jgi:phage tail-like protein